MASRSNSPSYQDSYQREKLTGFDNWEYWSGLTQLTPEEKGVWDIVDRSRAVAQTNVYRRDSAMAALIIKEGVHKDFFKNVADTDDPCEIWKKLKKVCS